MWMSLLKPSPSAKKIGVAKLPAYSFIFNTTASDESSKANVVKSFEPDAAVWGVLIGVDDNERFNFFNPDPATNDLKLEPVNCIARDGSIYHAEVFTAKPHAINTQFVALRLVPRQYYKIGQRIRSAGRLYQSVIRHEL